MLLHLHCQSTKHQYMPRQERTKSGTGIYHVMLRGINRQDIFEDDEDYLQMTAGLVSSPGDYSWSSWHEYAGTSAGRPCICKTSAVISRIDTADLLALIDEPLNDCMNIIDIETTEAVYHTDSELKEFLSNTHGVSNPLMVQSLEKNRRKYILKSTKDYGAGIRQLSRLTGVSYGVIQKL